MTVIDDTNWMDHVTTGTGYIPRPAGWVSGVEAAFPQHLLIPRVEWPALYEARKANTVAAMCARATTEQGLKWLNQNPTNYCWCYAVVHAVMILRLMSNEPVRRLVPASVAAIIKNFQNVGGWGSQALDFMVEQGVADESAWPQPTAMLAITAGRQYAESSRPNALQNRVTGFWRIDNLDEKMSALFNYMPVPCGYGWMGHEMCSIDPYFDEKTGQWGSVDLDSYATKDGMFNSRIILGKRAVGDDMVSPVSLLAA